MMVKDTDYLTELVEDFDDFVDSFKNSMGAELEAIIKDDIFMSGGKATQDTDPLNPRGVNPKWADLSWITVQLKGSSGILIDTQQLRNFVRWQIEDSEWDDLKGVVKVGWFEEAGDRVWIAAIHEFGLTGVTFRTPDGQIMGGIPIGRDAQSRANIRAWFYAKLGLRVTGRIIIPERSMLRKAADIIDPNLDQYADAIFLKWLEKIVV